MIHPLTLVTFAAFLGSGLYVFQTKEEVAKLDRELRGVTREIEGERSRTQTLSAEWARLNDQDRLRSMVTNHLREMQPMEPSQFQRLDDAQRRMPQAVAFVPESSTGFRRRADAPSAPGEVLVFSAATMLAEADPRRAVPAAQPAVVAAATPDPAFVAAAAPQPAAAPAPMTVASATPASRAAVAPRPEVAALQPVAGASIAAAPTTRPAPAVVHAPVELAAVASRASALTPIASPAATPATRAAESSAARIAESPAARIADATPTPRAVPRARVEAPAPRPAQLAQGSLATPVSAPSSPLRTAMHVQAAPVMGGSLLGGGMSLPPPVPFGR
jgi:hypothetical protein